MLTCEHPLPSYYQQKNNQMKQNTRDRASKSGRPSAVAAKAPSRPTIVTGEQDHATANSEDPLGGQPALSSDQNISKSPPGKVFETSTDVFAAGEPSAEPQEIKTAALSAAKKEASGSACRRFQSYELLWEHSKDALSTTYAVKNGAVNQILTLRLFNTRVCGSIQIKEIQRAAQKASELTHLHLATVYENGVDETGAPYVVSDLVEGNSLAEVLQLKKRLDIARFLDVFNQVGEALIEAHSHELFHGNLSPEKVVFTTNEIDADMVKLIDFGMPPDPVGNAFYLSPEQCIDKNRNDAKSDIYSLGCIMYEALVGTPPFVGSRQSQAALNYLHELANQFPKDSPEHNALKLLDCIIIKCLQKEPSKRFRDVRELMNALRLVNDCICNGSTKKLPPKAEKLLLFRFLDLFGNRIAACMTAYLILGFVCMRVIGEVNLQKHVDQATLSTHFNDLVSRSNWISAIKQAESLRKPPSFMAALHNNLGDSYAVAATYPHLIGSFHGAKNEEARKAIAEYQKAYEYYGRGHHFKAHSLALLRGINSMWTSLETKGLNDQRRADVLREVQKLWVEKKYSQCASEAEKYLHFVPDKRISFYAANSCTEIALGLPAAKALPYFERAAYYFGNSDRNLNFECDNLSICISRLGMVPEACNTRAALGRAAIERGDLQAAYAELSRSRDFEAISMSERIRGFLNWKIDFGATYIPDPLLKESIKPLEKILALEEEAAGKNSDLLIPTLSSLANTYRLCGEDTKAIDAYRRLLDFGPHMFAEQMEYVDLLCKVGRKAEARKYMEKEVGTMEKFDGFTPLAMRLLKAYSDDNMKQQLHDLLIHMLKYREPIRSIVMGNYQYPELPLASHPYSRNGVIYRK